MFYRLLGRIFFLLWVAPAISHAIRKILYPAVCDGILNAVEKDNQKYKDERLADFKDRITFRKPEEWERIEKLKVTEPAGWYGLDGEILKDWNTSISRREFFERAAVSSVEDVSDAGDE